MNNEMTFRSHLHGNDENEGLIQQLSKRAGIIGKLARYISPGNLKSFVAGIFYSKISYCLPLYGNVFGLEKYRDNTRKYINYTVRDNNKLQVLQNKINRILTRSKFGTSTSDLLMMTKSLSIQQMIALQTLVLTFKIIQTSKPSYLANKLQFDMRKQNLRSKAATLKLTQYKLNQSREGFINRGITLFNRLDEETRRSGSLPVFEKAARKWVLDNIKIKP